MEPIIEPCYSIVVTGRLLYPGDDIARVRYEEAARVMAEAYAESLSASGDQVAEAVQLVGRTATNRAGVVAEFPVRQEDAITWHWDHEERRHTAHLCSRECTPGVHRGWDLQVVQRPVEESRWDRPHLAYAWIVRERGTRTPATALGYAATLVHARQAAVRTARVMQSATA